MSGLEVKHSKLSARVLESIERLDEVWRERWPRYELDTALTAIAQHAIEKWPQRLTTVDLTVARLGLDDLLESDDVIEVIDEVATTEPDQLTWLAATLGRLMLLQFDEKDAGLAVEVYQRWRKVYKRLRQWYRSLESADLMVCLRFIRMLGSDEAALPFIDYLGKTWFRPGKVIHPTEERRVQAAMRSEAFAAGTSVAESWTRTLQTAIFKAWAELPSHLPRPLAYVPLLRCIGGEVQRAVLHGDTVKTAHRTVYDPNFGHVSVPRVIPFLPSFEPIDGRSDAEFERVELSATLEMVIPDEAEREFLLAYYASNNKRELAEQYGLSYQALRQRARRMIKKVRKNL